MAELTVEPDDLATYLNDPTVDEDRAQKFIDRAVTLCESVISPLPPQADVIVERIAGRAYSSAIGGRGRQITAAGSPFGPVPGAGAVYLTRYDKADLRRLAGGGGVFTIDTLGPDYVAPVSTVVPIVDDWDRPV